MRGFGFKENRGVAGVNKKLKRVTIMMMKEVLDGIWKERGGTSGIRRAPKLPFAAIRTRRIVEMEEDRGECYGGFIFFIFIIQIH